MRQFRPIRPKGYKKVHAVPKKGTKLICVISVAYLGSISWANRRPQAEDQNEEENEEKLRRNERNY